MSSLHPSAAAVGRTVRALREERGPISQEEFAEVAGITRSYLWSIESGRRNPSLKLLAQLARALDIPLSELIEQAERGSETDDRGSVG